MTDKFADHHIAIIGMACHFPAANTPQQFWENIRSGVAATESYTDEELLGRGAPQHLLDNPDYVKRGIRLPNHDQFDGAFFGIGSREAAMMDPQHRHFLETCWEALEDAGTIPGRYSGDIGVFAGSGHNAYMPYNLLTNADVMRSSDLFELRHTSNDKDFLTTRVSYCLNLTGLSINVQTACSTSLVAMHLGCQSLINGECDLVLAGGVTIEHPHGAGYLYREGEVLSPDGSCRAFDANSRGTVFGSGSGVVVLKPVNQALQDGDRIHAVILASALNNDGASKASYMAPGVDGQAAVVEETLELAAIDADTVTYMEAHGTGTALGDPIELAALNQVYRPRTSKRAFCRLGSVKPNIGHLDTAAGVASVIKVVMALKNRTLPGMLHFTEPNSNCDFDDSPFTVSAGAMDWNPECGVRRAGVSSLGVGGTNAHMVLQEAPVDTRSMESMQMRAFPMAARSAAELGQMRQELADFLLTNPATRLDDVAHTLQAGRAEFEFRGGHSAQTREQLIAALQRTAPAIPMAARNRPVSFLFAGGGSQRAGMGAKLYSEIAQYREDADRCLNAMDADIRNQIKVSLFAPDGGDEAALEQPSLSLPAITLTQYCMARLWISLGLQPAALIGHSLGDYAAACIAGVFTVEQAMALVQLRGRLLEKVAQPAAMTSVQSEPANLEALNLPGISIAAVNAPEMTLLSGTVTDIGAAEELLEARDISCRRVPIKAASHCALLDPVLAEFRAFVAGLKVGEIHIPVVNNRTGDWLTDEQAANPDYWVEHFRHTVYFSRGLSFLAQSGNHMFLEIGPGSTLTTFARQHDFAEHHPALTSMPKTPEEDELAHVAQCMIDLWCHGVEVNWNLLPGQPDGASMTSLPPYPFARKLCWIEGGQGLLMNPATNEATAAAGAVQLSTPRWLPLAATGAIPAKSLIVFTGAATASSSALQNHLATCGHQVCTAQLPGPAGFTEPELTGWLAETKSAACFIFAPAIANTAQENLQSLLALCKGLGELANDKPLALCVLSSRSQQVAGEPILHPAGAVLDPALRVAASEIPELSTLSVDVDDIHAPWQLQQQSRLITALLANLLQAEPPAWQALAVRANQSYSARYEPVVESAAESLLRKDGRYLIIGANGSIARQLAHHLRDKYTAKLMLAVRAAGPVASFAAALGPDDQIKVAEASLLDADQMRACLAECTAAWGGIDGVFQLAGAMDVDLIQVKTAHSMDAVLAPKIQANQALADALGDDPVDFVMLFSSVSGKIGMPGQFDYAAANGYVDAWASYQQQRGKPWMAVAWSAWVNAGWLALDSGSRIQLENSLFHHRADAGIDRIKLWRALASDEDWELLEHRTTTGIGVMPGTGYAALAVAAWREICGGFQPVSLEELAFVEAFALRAGERAEICVDLERSGDKWEFSISSANGTVEHARGALVALAENPKALTAPVLTGDPIEGILDHPFVRFGPRWANIDSAHRDGSSVRLAQSLGEQFHADLEVYDLHPAMHDVAVGGAQIPVGSNHGTEMLIPFSYEKIQVFAPLEAQTRVCSQLQSSDEQFAVIDYQIFNVAGQLLVSARNFSMRRIDPAVFEQLQSSLPPPDTDQLSYEDGIAAIDRILSGPLVPNISVSPANVNQIIASACLAANSAGAAPGSADENRPELATPYVAPETEVQLQLAALWSEGLGVSPIGMDDDFFELGGHSLLLARTSTKGQKLMGKRVATKRLFENPTLRSWEGVFSADEEATAVVKIKRVARDKYLRK